MKKTFLILILLLNTTKVFSFFAAEAESTKAYKIIEGGLAGSILIDDLSNMSVDGLDYSEVEALAIQHSKQAAKLKGKSESIAAEYEKIKYMDLYNSNSSKLTVNLKRASALYSSLCALSPESCGIAAQHMGNKKQDETTKAVKELSLNQSKKALEEKIKEQKEQERKIKTLKAINDYPTNLLKKIFKFGKN